MGAETGRSGLRNEYYDKRVPAVKAGTSEDGDKSRDHQKNRSSFFFTPISKPENVFCRRCFLYFVALFIFPFYMGD